MSRRKYITAGEYGRLLNPPISTNRVSILAAQGRIEGARPPHGWLIPVDAPDPRKPHGKPRKADPVRVREYHKQPGPLDQEQEHQNEQENVDQGNVQEISPLDALKQKYRGN